MREDTAGALLRGEFMANTMKIKSLVARAAALSLSILFTAGALGQDAIVQTSTTTSAGAIEQFVPDSELVLRTETAASPVRYSITRETRFVDAAGTPVAVERITPGAPVSVEYVRDGERTVVSRVVVRQAQPVVEHRKTTTTTTRELTDDEKDRLEDARDAEKERAEKVRDADKEHAKKLREIEED